MKLNKVLIVVAPFALASSAFAHPGHGTAPASEGGKPPHVHFGAAKASIPDVARKSTSAHESAKKPPATHATPVADKAPATHATPVADKAIRREH
jgi:hypothetical protein